MTAPALTFLAPPSPGGDDDSDAPRTRDGSPTGGVRMTRGAREAATGLKVSDRDIQRCLDAPDDVSPDPHTPSRTRFRRGDLLVLAGADGMVLRIDRGSR
jgi:hypothetical protein